VTDELDRMGRLVDDVTAIARIEIRERSAASRSTSAS